MIDCIVYMPDFVQGMAELKARFPEMVSETEDGELVEVGLARTEAQIQGTELMVYARIHTDEEQTLELLDQVELWGKTPYVSGGTANKVYGAVFDDPRTKEIYDRIYPRESYTFEMDGETITHTPPLWFGVIAGA